MNQIKYLPSLKMAAEIIEFLLLNIDREVQAYYYQRRELR
jgi:hypothetical protein